MSATAYKINDRRSSSGYINSNQLYEGATASTDSPAIPRLDRDQPRNISNYGWRQLVSASRYFVENFAPVKGAIDQMATYAIGEGFQPQYYGRNKAWGERVESLLFEYHKVCDVRGRPFDFKKNLVLDLMTIIRDGDSFKLFVKTPDGFPMFQSIPSHRIGSPNYTTRTVQTGPYQGMFCSNGVIQTEYGRPLAFEIYDDGYNSEPSATIGERDLKMTFEPKYYEQARGIPWLSAGINDLAKEKAIREFLMIAIEAESAHTILETNETGTPSPSTKSLFASTPTAANPTAPTVQNLSGGVYRYLKSGSGKLESLKSDRPHTNVMDFQFEILRGIFESLGWPIEFYNPEHLGGAPTRQRIAQAKRTLERLQGIAQNIATMEDAYIVAVHIQLGLLEPDPDWWMIKHQAPRDITVDNGRDIKALMDLYIRGLITMDQLCAENAEYWEDTMDQRIREEKRWQERCKEEGVDPDKIRTIASTSSQQMGMPDQQQKAQDQNA